MFLALLTMAFALQSCVAARPVGAKASTITAGSNAGDCLTFATHQTGAFYDIVGFVTVAACLNADNQAIDSQIWSAPSHGDVGPVTYLRQSGSLCLSLYDNVLTASTLTLVPCAEHAPQQRWTRRMDGLLAVGETDLCLNLIGDAELERAIHGDRLRNGQLQVANCYPRRR